MILSHRYRFIFIKTMKTAGTSLEVQLSALCAAGDVFTPILPPVAGHCPRNHRGLFNPFPEILAKGFPQVPQAIRDLLAGKRFYNHIPALLARARIGQRIWNNYYKFCVERNPWDKSLSHYWMFRKKLNIEFHEYLQRGVFCHNLPLYCDDSGKLMVDRVLRYDRLDSELAEVFSMLGIPWGGSLTPRAKANFRQDRRPYQEIYDSTGRELIAKAFTDEIRLHGFEY